jgi:hypothetical protein
MLLRALRWLDDRLGRRAVVWGAILMVLALVLNGLPLFNLLGFDFSFAMGLAAALAGVDIGHGAVVAARRTQRPTGLLPLTWRAIAGATAVLALPLFISLLNAVRVKNCNLLSGLGFYLLLPVGTAVYAAAAGVAVGVLAPRGARAIAFSLPVLSVLWSLLRLYRDPAVFAFDPFGGYFPGPIYDEALRPPARLLVFRAVNLVWAAAAVAVAAALSAGGRPRPDGPPTVTLRHTPLPRWSVAVAGVLLTAGMVLFQLRGTLGFHVRHRDLEAKLSRKIETPHFVLYTDPASGETTEDLMLVRRDLEFRFHQLRRILGVGPPGRISVYQFPNAAVKKELVGAANTLYAKPWTGEIFIQTDRFPASRLRHELAHVFAASFGDRFFGVALHWGLRPRLASGLIEGVAEAADYGDPDGRSTVHQEARAIVADGRAPPLRQVVGAGFTTLSGARAYTLAGSFCHFLLASHGAERLRALYRSAGDFQGVYGSSLESLEQQWRAFLEKQPLDAAERARAQERFRRPAIFQKVCARELAARVADARGRLYSAPAEAVALLESVCEDDPAEPTFRLDLADALVAAGQQGRALTTAGAVESDRGLTRPLRARAAALAAAVHFHAGRFDAAGAAVARAEALATDEGEERTALAKRRALVDPESRRTLGRVLFGDSPTRGTDAALVVHLMNEFAARHPDEALGPYLLARQLTWRDPRLALPQLERACPRGGPSLHRQPLAPPFLRECRRLLGEAAFRAGNLPLSRAAFQRQAADADNEAERLRARDFLERIDWEEQREKS